MQHDMAPATAASSTRQNDLTVHLPLEGYTALYFSPAVAGRVGRTNDGRGIVEVLNRAGEVVWQHDADTIEEATKALRRLEPWDLEPELSPEDRRRERDEFYGEAAYEHERWGR